MDKLGLNILLIEDNPGDVTLISEYLNEDTEYKKIYPNLKLSHISTLEKAVKYLKKHSFDLILLDLNLPDSSGINTLKTLIKFIDDIPIIVLTGLDDFSLAKTSISNGAQDFLFKNKLGSELLIRTIISSIQRHIYTSLLPIKNSNSIKEINDLKKLALASKTSITADVYGIKPLHIYSPEKFSDLSAIYKKTIEIAVEKRVYKSEKNYSEQFGILTEELCNLRVSPKDIINIHTNALNDLIKKNTKKKSMLFIEESRFLLLEIMGHMIIFYRKYAIRPYLFKKKGDKND